MTNQVDESVLRKIKKALALAEDGRGDPNTAAIALRQAQKLMEQHGVEMGHLAASDVGEAALDSVVSISRAKTWEVRLMVKIAEAFGCRVMISNGVGPKAKAYAHAGITYADGTPARYFARYTFIGHKSRVELAQYTAEVMLRKLLKARTAFVASLAPSMPRLMKSAEGDSFCLGWVNAVTATIEKFANPEALDKAIEARFEGKAVRETRHKVGSQLSRMAGQDAGSRESIRRPMSGREQLKIGA